MDLKMLKNNLFVWEIKTVSRNVSGSIRLENKQIIGLPIHDKAMIIGQ